VNEALVYGAAPAPSIRRLAFSGSGGPLFGIFLRNLFLSILTLGIYYFWGKVRARRYILGHVEFEGDRFGYHATGRELLLGWVKVAGFFALLYVVNFVVPLIWNSPVAAVLLGLAGYAVFLVVYPLAVVGSRRFRLSRTSWRGIRFSFRGRVRDFIRLYIGGLILSSFTLGLYYAFFQNNVRRFLITHSYFGTTRFGYDGRGEDLLGIYILAGVVIFGGLAALGIGLGLALPLILSLAQAAGSIPRWAPALLLIPLAVAAGLLLFWMWFLAARHRYYWGRTTVEGARFRSSVTAGKFLRLFAGDTLRLIPTLGLAWPYVVVRHIRFTFANLVLEGALDIDAIHQEAQTASAAGESLGEFFGLLDLDLGL
jgi:uncharacterized membrane protein YjgN (DUF898 family)